MRDPGQRKVGRSIEHSAALRRIHRSRSTQYRDIIVLGAIVTTGVKVEKPEGAQRRRTIQCCPTRDDERVRSRSRRQTRKATPKVPSRQQKTEEKVESAAARRRRVPLYKSVRARLACGDPRCSLHGRCARCIPGSRIGWGGMRAQRKRDTCRNPDGGMSEEEVVILSGRAIGRGKGKERKVAEGIITTEYHATR